MARHFKKGLDYFPLDLNLDDEVELLEAKYGLAGFALWVKLLMKIYSKMNYGVHFARWALMTRHLQTQVRQCLGRAIRSEQDRGAAIILDYRVVKHLFFNLPGMRILGLERD